MVKNYLVTYVVNSNVVQRELEAINFLSATIKAGTNLKYRPSLVGAVIRSIKEVSDVKKHT